MVYPVIPDVGEGFRTGVSVQGLWALLMLNLHRPLRFAPAGSTRAVAARAAAVAGAAGPAAVRAAGEVLVTPHNPANFGHPIYPGHFALVPPEPFFVDWLSIKQVYYNRDLPVVEAGVVMAVDANGVLLWQSRKPEQFKGSHDTSIRIRCDGHTVSLSGNVSRFGRRDNVFGLSLDAAIRKASAIVAEFGLPPFTAGQEMPVFRKRNSGEVYAVAEYNGARITRLDLTANYATGSAESAKLYMQWLASQQHSRRVKVGTYDNQTVDWGRGSRRVYAKAYIKGDELRYHGNAANEVTEFCDKVGLVRFELTAKATQLQSMGCHTVGGLHMGHLIHLFEDRRQVMTRATLDVDDLDQLPRSLRCTARDYLAGDNLVATLSERTFRRHRAGLLAYGIDIAVPSHIAQFTPRVRVIELRPVEVPDWYQLEGREAA